MSPKTQAMTTCAIHQPNFFPWLGYFDKIRRADIFIFLDNVAYPKSGSGAGSWVNRVRIPINNTPTWITCPIRREHGTQIIRDVRIDDSRHWRQKLLRTIAVTYGRALNYKAVIPHISKLVLFETDNLCDFNINAITSICKFLDIKAKFVMQSKLGTTSRSTELLIELTRIVEADTYLCGGGASGYQDDEIFSQNGITLEYQSFTPSPYCESNLFIPGMSVIDFLMKKTST